LLSLDLRPERAGLSPLHAFKNLSFVNYYRSNNVKLSW
jgi:hypothetical protein